MIPDFLDLPIFPLPNATLFPKSLLPLHIFEPRYRNMIARSLQGDRMIGIALLREGWQKDYFGRPPIHKTFGVGKIVDHERLNDGRYNIVLEGFYRVRLVEEYASEPFRVGRVAVLRDAPIDHLRSEISAIQRELSDSCRQLGRLLPSLREPLQGAWSAHPHPAVTADLLAALVAVDAYDRQSLIEELNPLRRLKLVLVQVRRILAQLEERSEVAEEVLEEE